MILLLGDVHGELDVINRQIHHARTTMGFVVDLVIQLGDFGVYRDVFSRFFDTEGQRFDAPVYFIDGNHEDFLFLDSAAIKYAHCLTHLKRGQVQTLAGYRMLFLGGSSYMDPINTPPGAVVTRADIERCLAHDPQDVDIVLTHDCPRRVCVPGSPEFDYCGPTGCAWTDELLDHFHPKLWFFAHHHRRFERREAGTDFFGLDLSFKGYTILNDNYKVTTVEHDLGIELDPSKLYREMAGRPHPQVGAASGALQRLVQRGLACLYGSQTKP